MEILGVIPARGGSKGIPRKNLLEVAGRPLIAWTCSAALESRELSRAVVSTDDDEIAAVAGRLGLQVVRRPAELAADDIPMLPVLLHALESSEGGDAVALLQPTSPLRTAQHVDEAVVLFRSSGADSVVSVVDVPHNFTPGSLLRLEGGRLVPLSPDSSTRRQEKDSFLARNGPAVVITRSEVLAAGSLYGDDCRPYPMSSLDSVDVDTQSDVELARILLDRRARQ